MTTRQLRVILKDTKLSASTILMLVGLFVIGFYLFKDKVKTKDDLIEVKAKLSNFSFHEYKGFRNNSFQYFLYFNDYNNKFQIVADFIDYFDKEYFERKVRIGDTLRVYLPLTSFNKINNKDKVKIFGLYGRKETFLDCENAIERYNSDFPLWAGFSFLIVGVLIFAYHSDKLKRIEKINKR